MEQMLDEAITKQINEMFMELVDPVHLLFFGGGKEQCEYCTETQQMLKEVAVLSDKVNLEVLDFEQDASLARQYQVERIPGLVVAGRDGDEILDYGVHFSGIPAGHEFTSLIHAILRVSSRDSGLSEKTKAYLGRVSRPVLLQVFVTPTCPYCPQAVALAHQMAIESPMIKAEMVEAMEFPDLSDQFGVSGVPHTTINSGQGEVIGAVPEDQLVEKIREVLEQGS